MLRTVPLLLSLVLFLPSLAEAQSAARTNEIGFSAAFLDFTEDDEEAVLILSLEYGRFLTEALEIGGGILMAGSLDEVDEEVDVTVFAQYHFTPEKTTSWFALAGYTATFEQVDVGFVGGGFGFRSYLKDNVAFSWELDYGISITDAVDGGAVLSLAGLSYFF